MKKTICLLSGGLDSTTTLYHALHEGYEVIALTVDYGQLHSRETESAKQIASSLKLKHFFVHTLLPWGGSALLDREMTLPVNRKENEMANGIPNTYVPARNAILLSLAASCAEAEGADSIHFGANILDYSGYPDCRPEFINAFMEMLKKGTKVGTENKSIQILAPLLLKNKKEIILIGKDLGVPFEKTWSCYQGAAQPCLKCDSCQLRLKGFNEAGFEDPLIQHHDLSTHSH